MSTEKGRALASKAMPLWEGVLKLMAMGEKQDTEAPHNNDTSLPWQIPRNEKYDYTKEK